MVHLPRILDLLKRKDYVPLPPERIAEALKLANDQLAAFKTELQEHLRTGTLVKLKKNRICLPRDADLVTGIIRFRQSGEALLMVESGEDGKPVAPLRVRAEDTAVAMHGDRVVCRINRHDYRDKRRSSRGKPQGQETTCRVIRILERARTTLSGTLKRSHNFFYVIPGDPRLIQDILVPDPAKSGLDPLPKVDDKVVVRLFPWEQRHLNPEGEITEVLGASHTPMAEYRAILHLYNLDPDFPDAVMAEVADIPAKVPRKALANRLDLRKLPILTIDPQDAKDFDDALSIETLADGKKRVGVHIADVSAYVAPGTALDAEARKRGNSTYLVGKVIPMLPHALSNGICSLVEGEDRLTKTVLLTFDAKAKLVQVEFANSVIRSSKRLSYEQAFALLKNDDLAAIRAIPSPPAHQTGFAGKELKSLSAAKLRQMQTIIRGLWELASVLRRNRMRKGSLELDMPESKIFVDAEGWADRIVRIDYDESHQLIEEFMLAANENVAKRLNDSHIPAIHRVHDAPDPEKLDDLADYLQSFEIQVGDLNQRNELAKALKAIRKHPQAHLLRVQVLRSLKQACYRATADGHFGLSKQHYLHFTSPIRRYADLVVHRVFDRHLDGERNEQQRRDRLSYPLSELSAIAQHLSRTEQNSTEAERESVKLKLMEFFERTLERDPGHAFKAVIMDVRNHGMFVELVESMAYGLIHVSTMEDDLFSLNSEGTALIGRRSKETYTVGRTIEVKVHRVDRFKRQIDFMLAGSTGIGRPAKKNTGGKAPTRKKERPSAQRNRGTGTRSRKRG